MPDCWINTISLEHVRIGMAGGFTQAGHGSDRRLRRLVRGDRIAFYSPKERLDAGAVVQAFTAVGTVDDDEPFRVELTSDFHPWRRVVVFDNSVCHAPIRPLLESLSFIPNSKKWGFPFRQELFRVPASDFQKIFTAMESKD